MAGHPSIVDPGPEDDSLLYLQTRHVSQAVWQGQADRILRIRRIAQEDHIFDPPLAIVPYLVRAGFFGVSRLGQFDFNAALVSALVERWRPETHTFHLTRGEATITLQDVAIQLGLPCTGQAVSGRTNYNWGIVCQQLLGVVPPPETMDGQRLSVPWLAQTFETLPDDADDETIQHFSRAYIMRLIGGYLMPDRTGHKVMLMYLPLLADFDEAGRYSWGSAVLTHLYREMCSATNYAEINIGGCLTLLHLWVWDHFPRLSPPLPTQPDPQIEIYPLSPPLGFRWRCVPQHIRPTTEALRTYRILLDQMKDDEFIWQPYDHPSVQQLIPNYCLAGSNIWRASVPIICFWLVEFHHADRVLRQFGQRQHIPQTPFNVGSLHTLQLRGKTHKDWRQEHVVFINAWNMWEEVVAHADIEASSLDRSSDYMRWYWRYTRRWIHPESGSQGFVTDILDNLYALSITDPPMLDYMGFRERTRGDIRTMLQALGEHREMLVSQPAPPAPHLQRPPEPEARPGKRGHGFISTREPLADTTRSGRCQTDAPPSYYTPTPVHEEIAEPRPSTFASFADYVGVSSSCAPSFAPGGFFSHFEDGGPSSFAPGSGSSSITSPAPQPFFSTPPTQTMQASGISFTTLFSDPCAFSTEFAGTSSDPWGSSIQQGFFTPNQPIPPAQSSQTTRQPNNGSTDEDEGEVEGEAEGEEAEQEPPQRRPQRQRRRPRCGTGGYIG